MCITWPAPWMFSEEISQSNDQDNTCCGSGKEQIVLSFFRFLGFMECVPAFFVTEFLIERDGVTAMLTM